MKRGCIKSDDFDVINLIFTKRCNMSQANSDKISCATLPARLFSNLYLKFPQSMVTSFRSIFWMQTRSLISNSSSLNMLQWKRCMINLVAFIAICEKRQEEKLVAIRACMRIPYSPIP